MYLIVVLLFYSLPYGVLASPYRVLASPYKVLASPYIVLASPYRVVASPYKVLASPYKVLASLYKVLAIPYRVSAIQLDNCLSCTNCTFLTIQLYKRPRYLKYNCSTCAQLSPYISLTTIYILFVFYSSGESVWYKNNK